MAEICFQKAPGQDLAKNGRFPMIPEEKFNSRPRDRQMAEICLQKAPGQDLAKNGRFPMIPEEKCNRRPKELPNGLNLLRFLAIPSFFLLAPPPCGSLRCSAFDVQTGEGATVQGRGFFWLLKGILSNTISVQPC